MPKLTLLVGPPGSGKTTFAKDRIQNDGDHGLSTVYVNQDSQSGEHIDIFQNALYDAKDIILDRMNFNRSQRERYIGPAKLKRYEIEIHVFHQPHAVCLERVSKRTNHETIKDLVTANKAIDFFFKSYERVEDWEADKVVRHWPEGDKLSCIVVDLDGTLCDCSHRIHHVRTEGKKKNWMAFMDGIPNDTLNVWCAEIMRGMSPKHKIVLCSGRGLEQIVPTTDWLQKNGIEYDALFMRKAGDSRKDSTIKEIILDFEILSRYKPLFFVDDRKQVYEMWRKRGFVCLACDEGNF